ncbi:MAG: 1-acyl-sn-glycerol-3-phosphate acyltransferase [Clostridia bacterium]|nr:1-acyl-sn-glycerol-3-phosphate acyltransferase [Clostridia bacterium]
MSLRDRKKNHIAVFYACDTNFLKFTMVSMAGLVRCASPEYVYDLHILHADIPEADQRRYRAGFEALKGNLRVNLTFDDVTVYLTSIADKLPVRDYYTKTTYYRLFIAEMYPSLSKALYIDSDTVVKGDISKLWETELEDNYVAACHEQVMVQTECYGQYVEQVIGISRHKFFNAGVLLINCKKFRKEYVLEQFFDLLGQYKFVVTQDEDYLNVICKDRVHFLPQIWNAEVFGELKCTGDEACIIHYIMTSKPWHYRDCLWNEYFWADAERTIYAKEIHAMCDAYTDQERERDQRTVSNLEKTAWAELANPNNFMWSVIRAKLAPDRLKVLAKIEEYEKNGWFDRDVEDDPPAPVLMPDQIEYIRRDLISNLKTAFAFAGARRYLNRMIRDGVLRIKEMRGLENLTSLSTGAVLTCNHFGAIDSFIVQMAYDAAKPKNRELYRVIREGNYTNFPGFYGRLMRNCNTLPLSSNSRTMRKFIRATGELLREGHLVLFYPEQSMWWNYRKPKPVKGGAYSFAIQNRVPVVPLFITMEDTDTLGKDGFFIQEYVVHVGKPIASDPEASYKENMDRMMQQQQDWWKEVYESTYGIPLTYTTVTPEEKTDKS